MDILEDQLVAARDRLAPPWGLCHVNSRRSSHGRIWGLNNVLPCLVFQFQRLTLVSHRLVLSGALFPPNPDRPPITRLGTESEDDV